MKQRLKKAFLLGCYPAGISSFFWAGLLIVPICEKKGEIVGFISAISMFIVGSILIKISKS